MNGENIFLFGAGYSTKAFARESAGATIVGTTRSPEKFEVLRRAGVAPLVFDGALTPEIGEALAAATHLVTSIAPEEAGDPVLNAARAFIAEKMPALRWIGYLSTVGVYGDRGGGWVDEAGECRPVSRRSAMRVEAEQEWLALGRRIGRPVAVLRLSGIYGPGRNAFVNLPPGASSSRARSSTASIATISRARFGISPTARSAASSTSPTTVRRRRRTWSPTPPR